MSVLSYVMLALVAVVFCVYGVMEYLSRRRNAKLALEESDQEENLDIFLTKQAALKPKEVVRYTQALTKWNEMIAEATKNLPQIPGYRDGNTRNDPFHYAIAHNTTHNNMEVWLRDKQVVHATGKQACDFLAMHPKLVVPEPTPLRPEPILQPEARAEINDLIGKAINASLLRAENDIEINLRHSLLVAVEEKVKNAVRDLLKETLNAVAENALVAAKAAEDETRKLEEQKAREDEEEFYQKAREDEEYYQKVLVEEQEKLQPMQYEISCNEVTTTPRKKPKKRKTSSRKPNKKYGLHKRKK